MKLEGDLNYPCPTCYQVRRHHNAKIVGEIEYKVGQTEDKWGWIFPDKRPVVRGKFDLSKASSYKCKIIQCVECQDAYVVYGVIVIRKIPYSTYSPFGDN